MIPLTEREKETIQIMREAGVFSVKGGVVEMNFDMNGALTRIDLHQMAFRRVKVELSTPSIATSGKAHIIQGT